MITYRCPYCGDTKFVVQDIASPDGKTVTTAIEVKVECTACHWVGSVDELGGNH